MIGFVIRPRGVVGRAHLLLVGTQPRNDGLGA
jgi:hypothetical protein